MAGIEMGNVGNRSKAFAQQTSKLAFDTVANTLNKVGINIENNSRNLIFFILLLVIFAILFFYNLVQSVRQESVEVSNMRNSLKPFNIQISSFNENNAKYTGALRDYYIMTSYNSCCIGRFKDSYVSLDALRMVMGLGVRCLDFEIYTLNDAPVVAVSAYDDYHIKSSYNFIPFDDVIRLVGITAFSSSVPNPNDPLLLHFRLKTNIVTMCDKIAVSIKNNIPASRLTNIEYGYMAGGENISSKPVSSFQGKTIIMVSRENPMWDTPNSKLAEMVNIATSSNFIRSLRNYDVQFAHNVDELTEYNKKNMTLSMPDLSTEITNPSPSIHMSYGVQMVAMSFQPEGSSIDAKLEAYLNFFNKERSAFVLKPEKLRYIPVTVPVPKTQNPELSFSQKTIDKPYFKHVI